MPSYNNQFTSPAYIEETINDSAGKVIGKIRIKPSSVLWKPKNQQKFYSVSLDQFADWITNPATKAGRTSS